MKKTIKELGLHKQPHEDVQGALDTLKIIAHLNLHGNVEKSQMDCIEQIRTALMQYDPDVICINKSDVQEGLKEAAKKIGIAGNHLGCVIPDSHPFYTASAEDVLELYGAGNKYDCWVAWKLCYEAYNLLCAYIEQAALVAEKVGE